MNSRLVSVVGFGGLLLLEGTHSASHEYALWLSRNFGGGYGAYFDWQPEK